jgi:hypothetical protein
MNIYSHTQLGLLAVFSFAVGIYLYTVVAA